MTAVEEPSRAVNLAAEPDFRLGDAVVRPSACRVNAGGEEHRLEPRVMEVLVALARRPGQTVTRDQLVDACWGGRAVSDDAVNRVLAQVRNLARTIEPSPFVLETVPKVGVRLLATPPSLAAPGGVVQRSDGDDAAPPADRSPPNRSRAKAYALIGAGVVALGLLAGTALVLIPRAPRQTGRVEVIQFEARQTDPAIRRLSVAVGESLVEYLARAGVDTAPRVALPGDGANPANAEIRIAGSVDNQGEDILVRTQVLDIKSGLVLGSTENKRPVSATETIPRFVASGVTAALDCVLEDRKRSGQPMEPETFALYFSACDSLTREGNSSRLLQSARRLVARAPKLAVGLALYAVAQAHMAEALTFGQSEADALRKGARASALQALAIDPNTPKAYVALAFSYPKGPYWLPREEALSKAFQIDPGLTPGRIYYVLLLREVGRLQEAREMARRVMDSGDPRTGEGARYHFALLSSQLGDLQSAQRLHDELAGGDPGAANSVYWNASSWAPPQMGLAWLRSRDPSGLDPNAFACSTAFLSELQKRIDAHARGLPPACDGAPSRRRLAFLAREGDLDAAFAEASRSAQSPDMFYGVFFEPEMAAFRADPRFMPFARRVGLVDYWRASGHWPDFCNAKDRPYDCRAAAGA